MERTGEIRNKIADVAQQPLERHGDIFNAINEELSNQLKEIESA